VHQDDAATLAVVPRHSEESRQAAGAAKLFRYDFTHEFPFVAARFRASPRC
jgi:hypothetical protein